MLWTDNEHSEVFYTPKVTDRLAEREFKSVCEREGYLSQVFWGRRNLQRFSKSRRASQVCKKPKLLAKDQDFLMIEESTGLLITDDDEVLKVCMIERRESYREGWRECT